MFDNICLFLLYYMEHSLNNKWLVLLSAMILLLSLQKAIAVDIEHINVGRIVVSDQSLVAQQDAGKKALAQVFIKISGDTSSVEHPTIARSIENFEQFLSSSSFVQIEQQLVFEAQFNKNKIENLLLSVGLPVWPNLRPNAIVWLSSRLDTEDKRTIVYQNNASQTSTILQKQILDSAYNRGVDILFPLGDLEDSLAVTEYDLWAQNVSLLLNHSVRYSSDFTIIATLEPYTYDRYLKEQEALKQSSEIEESDELLDQVLNSFYNEASNGVNDFSELNQSVSLAEEAFENISELASQSVVNSTDDASISNDDASAPNNVIEPLPRELQPVPDEQTQYKVDYIISNRSQIKTGVLYSENVDNSVSKLVDEYADYLAKQYALVNNKQEAQVNKVVVNVENISTLADLLLVKELFESVPAIDNIYLKSQVNDVSSFVLTQNLSADKLQRILALDERVEAHLRDKDTLKITWQGN